MMQGETVRTGAPIPPGEELRVLKSNAGWYVGYWHKSEEGFQEPYSRETGYFSAAYEANDVLLEMNRTPMEGWHTIRGVRT